MKIRELVLLPILLWPFFQITTIVFAPPVIRSASTGGLGIFEPAPCPIAIPDGLVEGKSIICGYVAVPEHHSNSDGTTLRLAVARFPSLSKTPTPDPIVLLAGGPGESNFEAFIPGMASPVGAQFRARHDIVVIELRGLLHSQPNLLCPERFDVQEAQLAVDPGSVQAITADLSAIQACHDRLLGQGINLAVFNNRESAADIVFVMTALGYDQFDLYGNSAGTLLAQHVMRAYPRRLRAVALGSVVPLSVSTWPAMPANGTRALKRLFESCAADATCHQAYPTLEVDFLSLIDRLNQRPVTISLENPTAQKAFQLLLTGDRAAQWIYNLLLTDANAGSSIPFVINRLVLEDYRPLQMGVGFFLPAQSFSQGLQYSVACAEKSQFSLTAIDLNGPYPAFAKAVSALPFGPERLLDACKIWNVPYLGASTNEAVASDIPSLLLAGDFDPGIPPSYPQRVSQSLSNAYVYTFPGVAHSPIDGGACPLSIALAFVDEPAKAPDSTCISGMQAHFVSEPIAERLLSPSIPHLLLLLICALVMLSALAAWGVAAWRNRRNPNLLSRRVPLARWYAVITCGLNLVFLLIVILCDPMQIIYGYPLVLRAAMLLPLLSCLPLAGMVFSTFLAWKDPAESITQRLYYTFITLALLVFVWQLSYWHLLGWRL
jgi:pimeloyl-ACP methyl ester carboxylesterase